MQVRRGRPRKVAIGLRACSAGCLPAQRTSPDRSLAGIINRRIRCRHSPRRHRTGKVRTLPSFIFLTSLTQHRFALAVSLSLRCASCLLCGNCNIASGSKSKLHFRCNDFEMEGRGTERKSSGFMAEFQNRRGQCSTNSCSSKTDQHWSIVFDDNRAYLGCVKD